MLTVRAGSYSLWCSLLILVAATVTPLERWNTAVKIVFVEINGADERNTWEVAPVLLTAKGMDPLKTAARSAGGDAWRNSVFSLSSQGRRFCLQ